MLAFHEATASPRPVPSSRTGCRCPDADPNVLPGAVAASLRVCSFEEQGTQLPDKSSRSYCVRVSDRGSSIYTGAVSIMGLGSAHVNWCQDQARLSLPCCLGCRNAVRGNRLCSLATEPMTKDFLQNHG